jgi:hypothetical protein
MLPHLYLPLRIDAWCVLSEVQNGHLRNTNYQIQPVAALPQGYALILGLRRICNVRRLGVAYTMK